MTRNAPQNLVFHLEQGPEIGSGGCGLVYQARDINSGRLVALKKSRASLTLKRTELHYEACVLKRLAGHPSIPTVFAYGRFAHFEYLAMELLGRDLSHVVKEKGPLALEFVLEIADQTISALQHVHKFGIVHRDIKPSNLLLHQNQHSEIRLIDFGLSRPNQEGEPQIRAPSIAHNYVLGTLLYASLNAHQGIDLNPRDDLESLAYTLLFLLKGNLPWGTYSEHGTVLGRNAQVRKQKQTWTGSKFVQYCPPEFGELVDYARGLKFTEHINYRSILAQFANRRKMPVVPPQLQDWTTTFTEAQPYRCPVEIGDLVSVQVLVRTSIEGYSLQGLDGPWHNPALSSEEFATIARPAIVINTAVDRTTSLFKIQVVPVARDTPVETVTPAEGVSGHIALSSQRSDRETMVVLQPAWPMSDTYCYAFPRAPCFYCLSSQTPTRSHWKVNWEDIEVLRQRFAKPFPMSFPTKRIVDPTRRYETRIFFQNTKVFASLTTLEPTNLTAKAMDWRGDRGFFDECVSIARQRGLEDGYFQWTEAPVEQEDDITNSYDGDDHSIWDAYALQRERKSELTLNQSHQEPFGEEGELGFIVEVL